VAILQGPDGRALALEVGTGTSRYLKRAASGGADDWEAYQTPDGRTFIASRADMAKAVWAHDLFSPPPPPATPATPVPKRPRVALSPPPSGLPRTSRAARGSGGSGGSGSSAGAAEAVAKASAERDAEAAEEAEEEAGEEEAVEEAGAEEAGAEAEEAAGEEADEANAIPFSSAVAEAQTQPPPAPEEVSSSD
jgi:hypothetical protein